MAVYPPRTRQERHAWRRRHLATLERVAVERVIALLEAEVRTLADLWSPELEESRARAMGRAGRPEVAFSLDDEPAAIDVTWFTTNARAKASARARAVARQVHAAIRDADPAVIPRGVLLYDPDKLRRAASGSVEDDGVRLAELLLEAASRPEPGGRVAIEASQLPSWAVRLTITKQAGRLGPWTLHAWPPRNVDEQVPKILEEVASKKGRQLAGWGRGIVALLGSGSDYQFDEAVAGLQARVDWPFWRVYWIDAGAARLAWRQGGEQ